MIWWLLIWAIGAVALLSGFWVLLVLLGGAPVPRDELFGAAMTALIWPLVAALILLGMAFSFAQFLIAVARKPH